MSQQPSDTYYKALNLTKRHHSSQAKTFSGQFTWKNRHRIKEIIDRFDVKSILDYGCGAGRQYQNIDPDTKQNLEQYWGVKTTKYDPGVERYSREPVGVFDLVICIQVLGSIPKGDLSWVVDRLYNYATKVVFVSERLGVPRKKIYESIVDEMPYGISKEEWMNVLNVDSIGDKTLIAMFKTGDGWETWNASALVAEEIRRDV